MTSGWASLTKHKCNWEQIRIRPIPEAILISYQSVSKARKVGRWGCPSRKFKDWHLQQTTEFSRWLSFVLLVFACCFFVYFAATTLLNPAVVIHGIHKKSFVQNIQILVSHCVVLYVFKLSELKTSYKVRWQQNNNFQQNRLSKNSKESPCAMLDDKDASVKN